MSLFYSLLYQPLFNFLIFLYNVIPGHNFGVATILLTFLVDFILLPISIGSTRSQLSLQKIQPKIKEIQKKYKDDKERQARLMMDLYKEEGVNPFSGFLFLLIQLPILFALYRVFWKGMDPKFLVGLYSFVRNPGSINPYFLSINLSQPSILLAILAGVLSYIQVKLTLPEQKKNKSDKNDFSSALSSQMAYITPIFIIIILIKLPSALGLYLIANSVFMIIEQYFVLEEVKVNYEKKQ